MTDDRPPNLRSVGDQHTMTQPSMTTQTQFKRVDWRHQKVQNSLHQILQGGPFVIRHLLIRNESPEISRGVDRGRETYGQYGHLWSQHFETSSITRSCGTIAPYGTREALRGQRLRDHLHNYVSRDTALSLTLLR